MARPSKYSQEREAKIVEALAAGNTRRTAARLAGIGETTLLEWMGRFRSFRAAIEKAEAEAEAAHVANIARAAIDGTWTASAWWLERRRHQDWGKRDRVEIIQSVREMARAAGQDEEAAVAEAEQFLKDIRSGRA